MLNLNPLYRDFSDSGSDFRDLQIETVQNGNLWRKSSRNFTGAAFVIVTAIVGGMVFLQWNRNFRELMTQAVIIMVVAIIIAVVFARQQMSQLQREVQERHARLTAPGGARILVGEFLKVEVLPNGYNLQTIVDYAFTNPAGQRLTGQQIVSGLIEVPEPGTRVRVLYADDETYVML